MNTQTSAATLIKACQNGSMNSLSIAAKTDYGMDFHAKADPRDIFRCYQNVLTHTNISCVDLHEALLANKLNEVVLARCTDAALRTKIQTVGGIYNVYIYEEDVAAGKTVDVSIAEKQFDFVMQRILR